MGYEILYNSTLHLNKQNFFNDFYYFSVILKCFKVYLKNIFWLHKYLILENTIYICI